MHCYLFKINKDDTHAVCPFCNYISKDRDYEETLQFDDYVDQPMIWCDECGARAFLDIDIDMLELLHLENLKQYLPEDRLSDAQVKKLEELLPKYEIDSKEIPHEIVSKIARNFEVKETEKLRFFKAEILFVKRVKNYMLLDYTAKDLISEENINTLIQLNKNIYDSEKMADLSDFGIIKKLDDEKEFNIEEEFNVSLPCNSYNIENPAKSYPENFYLKHDGVFVSCEVVHNGKICYYEYWGD